ncbi:hypothetical protein ACLOJK_031908 [Asimina triloba]
MVFTSPTVDSGSAKFWRSKGMIRTCGLVGRIETTVLLAVVEMEPPNETSTLAARDMLIAKYRRQMNPGILHGLSSLEFVCFVEHTYWNLTDKGSSLIQVHVFRSVLRKHQNVVLIRPLQSFCNSYQAKRSGSCYEEIEKTNRRDYCFSARRPLDSRARLIRAIHHVIPAMLA